MHNPELLGIYDQNGNLIDNTSDGDGRNGMNSELVYMAAESATHYIVASGISGFVRPSLGTYRVSVHALADDYLAAAGTTGAVAVGESTTGELEFDGDRDWFAGTLEAGNTYRIEVKGDTEAEHGGTLYNPALAMYDTSGSAIAFAADDNSGVGRNARLAAFAPDTDGTYCIEVNDPGGLGTYTAAVEEDIRGLPNQSEEAHRNEPTGQTWARPGVAA